MTSFLSHHPSLDGYWRGVVLLGRNSAAYKFALAGALLEKAGNGLSDTTLRDIALPFAGRVAAHLKMADRQSTSASSKFLDACRAFNRGDISEDELAARTVREGFRNVLDAFHVVNGGPIPLRFFEFDKLHKRIVFTDSLHDLSGGFQARNLPTELEARWRLVETAWELQLPSQMLRVEYVPDVRELFVSGAARRIAVTSCRDALNGYQKGRCFYCFREIAVTGDERGADVDHFFPHVLLGAADGAPNINGVWNLVLACRGCNRGASGKFARVPEARLLERLHRRNGFLIESHHPLRETLIAQTGATDKDRSAYLTQVDRLAIERLLHRWSPADEAEAAF